MGPVHSVSLPLLLWSATRGSMSVRSAIRTALKEYSPLIKQLLEAVIAAGGARPDAQTPAAVMNLIIQHEANLQQLVKQRTSIIVVCLN